MTEIENHSTGPRTEAGKQRSSQNAITHGLFAKTTLIAGESQEDFDTLLGLFQKDHKPSGITENVMVARLADIEWRLRRLSMLEARAIEKALESGDTDLKFMTNYSMYEQRLTRNFQSTLKSLKELQAPRWKQNGLLFRCALIILDWKKWKGLPWDPKEDGFDFSLEQLEKQHTWNQHADEAMRESYYYATTKEMDERYSKEAA